MPPLSALRAFEAAARHGSFKQASEELLVTPTAISHQIRGLEEHVGLALFERRTRQVVLTDAGARLYPVLRNGFDAFAETIEALTRRQTRRRVTISATTAFTVRWLVPRVSGFRALHPDVDLQIQASDEVIKFGPAGIDIAIRYGAGPYPDFQVTQLFADRFAPLFNPLLKVKSAADIAQHPLINFQWRRQHPDNPTWSRWFAEAAIPQPQEPAQLSFSDESHAIQAAVAGQGIVLASLALVEDEIEAGRLVHPFGPSISGYKHHILTLPGALTPEVAAAVRWLQAEAAKSAPRDSPS